MSKANGKRFLTKDDILGVPDRPIEEVHVPEWFDGWVGVRGLGGTSRSEYLAAMFSGPDTKPDIVNSDVRLAALSMVDLASGEPMFTLEDVAQLGQKSASALNRIVDVAQRLSALRPVDLEEKAAGLDETPSDDSISS